MVLRGSRFVTALFALAIPLAGAGGGLANEEPPVPAPEAATADQAQTTPSPLKLPPPPPAQLAPIGEYADPAAYVAAMAARVDELATQAGVAIDGLVRTELLMGAANTILAYQLEPACTSRFLGMSGAPPPLTEEALRAALDRADALLVEAGEILRSFKTQEEKEREQSQAEEGDEPRTARLLETQRRLEALRVFAEALRAYLLTDETEPAAPGAGAANDPDSGESESVRRAAAQLSVLLEAMDPQVVAGAAFWQACLRSRSGDPSRLMPLLGMPLSDPSPKAMPFAFFSRLLGCRLRAAAGGHAAALALLTQMEELCDDWMDEGPDRADALRAVTLVELQVLTDWHEYLSGPTNDAARQWCVDRIATLSAERFSEEGRTVLRLTPAVPMVAPRQPGSARGR